MDRGEDSYSRDDRDKVGELSLGEQKAEAEAAGDLGLKVYIERGKDKKAQGDLR